jgi:hypothetical protein
MAAVQVVLHLLRTMRVELDLVRDADAEGGRVAVQPGSPGAVLFVRAVSDAPNGNPVSDPNYEATLRAHIERSYARRAIANVAYELHLL